MGREEDMDRRSSRTEASLRWYRGDATRGTEVLQTGSHGSGTRQTSRDKLMEVTGLRECTQQHGRQYISLPLFTRDAGIVNKGLFVR